MFNILSGDAVVGTTELEHLDEGMGVASGAFLPSPGYAAIRAAVILAAEARHRRITHDGPVLNVASEDGRIIANAVAVITDFAVPVDPEVTVFAESPDAWQRISRRRG